MVTPSATPRLAAAAIVRSIGQLEMEGLTVLLERLDDYARAADVVGCADLEAVTGAPSLGETIRGVVLGMISS